MQKSKKGLTVIELLVTIAILGIIASLSLSSVQSVRESARTKNAALLASAMIASLSFCIDNNKQINFINFSDPICDDTSIKWSDFGDTQWSWFAGEHNLFNDTYTFRATDESEATGCITCTQFGCTTDKTVDCS